MLEYDQDHLRAQLDHRGAHLAVLMFGGNDMIRNISMDEYRAEYRQVLRHVRDARPDMDCLVMAPLDHGERQGVRIVSRPVVPAMVEAQREAAKAEGCAFFDTYAAMGGEGSAGRWFRRTPRLMGGDLGHATHNGHQVIGELFYRAVVEAYVDYRERMDAQGGIEIGTKEEAR
jgi:lysophospholipase L1-like esterase